MEYNIGKMEYKLEYLKSVWENEILENKMAVHIPFFLFLSEKLTLTELELLFDELRNKLNSSPCCLRHSGSVPISVHSLEKTPPAEVPPEGSQERATFRSCTNSIRNYCRNVSRAYFLKNTGQFPTDLNPLNRSE
jgi:hypothetical protein